VKRATCGGIAAVGASLLLSACGGGAALMNGQRMPVSRWVRLEAPVWQTVLDDEFGGMLISAMLIRQDMAAEEVSTLLGQPYRRCADDGERLLSRMKAKEVWLYHVPGSAHLNLAIGLDDGHVVSVAVCSALGTRYPMTGELTELHEFWFESSVDYAPRP